MNMLTLFLQADKSTIRQIATRVVDIASNTTPSWVGMSADVITIVSGFVGTLAIVTIWWEFRKNQLSLGCQYSILQDLFRHFYRNKVVLVAMLRDWKEKGYDSVRPSEDILLKTQTLPEDLNFSRFAVSDECYSRMHEIELNLRNYNIVAEIAADHVKCPEIPIGIKLAEVEQLERRSAKVRQMIADLCPLMGIVCEGSTTRLKRPWYYWLGLCGKKWSIISGWKTSGYYKEGLTEDDVFEKDVAEWRQLQLNIFLPLPNCSGQQR